ncbi:Transmembrane alpha-helix domain [Ceratobasidium sp. AG-Ba]|nr:Transmembrane alpha-helix domain [Ceratobasidium sp. AG-Ba]
MPLQNVTIDDISALIQYAPLGDVWKDSPTSDSGLGSYYDSTYHSAIQYGASATFQFDGIAVYIYAAKRFQHGAYSIQLDGKQVYNGTFQSNASVYKQLMYGVSGLNPGIHTLTCTNNDPSNKTYMEVDYITWTTSMDASLTEVETTSIGVSNMTYSSMAAWKADSDSEPTMITTTDGASVTINFQGNGIELQGKTGLPYGAFSAQVDNNPSRQLNAQSQQTHTTLLFREDNLASGNHTLVVTNRGGGFTSLAIGKATPIIWTSDPNGTPSANSSSPPTHTGAIAGGVVGGVVGLAAVLLFILWFFRRRRAKQRAEDADVIQPAPEPGFLSTTPFVLPPANTASSYRESKLTAGDDYTQSGMSMYQSVPRSPGMSSRGSFDHAAGLASAAGSSSAGTAMGGGWSRPGGKEIRHSGPTIRQEQQFDEESLRDRDAGPVLLPQLPPAYSSAATPDPVPSGSRPSPVPTVPTPIPGTADIRQHEDPAPVPSPRPT